MSAQLHTVGIVDDDAGMRQAMERLLNAAGYRSIAFESAEHALQSSTVVEARCLVLDIRLPGMSGIELFERLTNRSPASVIFITSHDNRTTRETILEMGAAYLAKPFEGGSLVSAVQRAIASASET